MFEFIVLIIVIYVIYNFIVDVDSKSGYRKTNDGRKAKKISKNKFKVNNKKGNTLDRIKKDFNYLSGMFNLEEKPLSNPNKYNDIITPTFYISTYICPDCNHHMYKTVFHEEYLINSWNIKRIFTCPECKAFYAPRPGFKLSANNGFYIKGLDEDEYFELLKDMSMKGSIKGRLDL